MMQWVGGRLPHMSMGTTNEDAAEDIFRSTALTAVTSLFFSSWWSLVLFAFVFAVT